MLLAPALAMIAAIGAGPAGPTGPVGVTARADAASVAAPIAAGPNVAAPPAAGPNVAAPPAAGPNVAAPPAAGPNVAAPPAAAPSATTPSVTAVASPASAVCVVDDARAVELSGLIVTAAGFVAVNDSQLASADMRIFYLDTNCKVIKTVAYPTPARDPEDLALAPDGTLWVADIGDNMTSDNRRRTIALWQVPAAGGDPVIHRLTYPDGPHDAEALLITADGAPLIVTKDPSGRSGLYQPTGQLQAGTQQGVALRRVGEFAPRVTGENNAFGPMGEMMVTAAAISPDRGRVVLRTYTAAYEWDVPNGDVVKAITTAEPRVTSLPDEPQGEAIAYTADGMSFLTVSDRVGPSTILRYTRSMTTLAPAASGAPQQPAAPAPTGLGAFPVWAALLAATVGLSLAAAGFIGLRRSRSRQLSL